MLKLFLAAFMTLLIAAPAYAGTCYTDKEAEAEQGIRIHSELMVIGLNCQHLWPKTQKNLYSQYREFTNAHVGLFREYDATMISYFSRAGGGNAEGRLHDLRTRFANDIARKAASVRPDVFCMYYAPRVPKASGMSNAEVKAWAATAFDTQPTGQPRCAN